MRRLCRRARLGGMTDFNSLSHAACRMRSASYPPSARQCSPWTKSRSSSARVASCCWPGVNRSSIGCPSKVTTAWSFVENPPRDLPSALAAGPPRPPAASWCARTIEASRIEPLGCRETAVSTNRGVLSCGTDCTPSSTDQSWHPGHARVHL